MLSTFPPNLYRYRLTNQPEISEKIEGTGDKAKNYIHFSGALNPQDEESRFVILCLGINFASQELKWRLGILNLRPSLCLVLNTGTEVEKYNLSFAFIPTSILVLCHMMVSTSLPEVKQSSESWRLAWNILLNCLLSLISSPYSPKLKCHVLHCWAKWMNWTLTILGIGPISSPLHLLRRSAPPPPVRHRVRQRGPKIKSIEYTVC